MIAALIDHGLKVEEARAFAFGLVREKADPSAPRTVIGYAEVCEEIETIERELDAKTRYRNALVAVRDRMAVNESTSHHTPPEKAREQHG